MEPCYSSFLLFTRALLLTLPRSPSPFTRRRWSVDPRMPRCFRIFDIFLHLLVYILSSSKPGRRMAEEAFV